MASIPVARPMVLRILRAILNRDITIRHGWTRDHLRLHAFKHRGYWFHGRARESREIHLATALLPHDGRLIIDVGSHIGFLSLYYRRAAPQAPVIAVEPSPANLHYLQQNVGPAGIRIVAAAVGSAPGTATLYEDHLTGQNSSLVEDFTVLRRNVDASGLDAEKQSIAVPVKTLDGIVDDIAGIPGFMKIDVEGHEQEALLGAHQILSVHRPHLQIELQRSARLIVEALHAHSYTIFSPVERETLVRTEGPIVVFAVHVDSPLLASFERSAKEDGWTRIANLEY